MPYVKKTTTSVCQIVHTQHNKPSASLTLERGCGYPWAIRLSSSPSPSVWSIFRVCFLRPTWFIVLFLLRFMDRKIMPLLLCCRIFVARWLNRSIIDWRNPCLRTADCIKLLEGELMCDLLLRFYFKLGINKARWWWYGVWKIPRDFKLFEHCMKVFEIIMHASLR